jgi:hypothetical protein
MLESLLSGDLVTIAIVLVVLVVAWGLLRAVLRLTARVFTLGCVGLVVLGLVLVALNYLNISF